MPIVKFSPRKSPERLSKADTILDSIDSVTIIEGVNLTVTFSPMSKISWVDIYIFSTHFVTCLKKLGKKIPLIIPLVRTTGTIEGKTIRIDLSRYKNKKNNKVTRLIGYSDEISFVHYRTGESISFIRS